MIGSASPRTALSDAERATGLTAPLPAGERLVWQGKPVPRAFTRAVFRARGFTIYAAVVALIVVVAASRDRPIGQAIATATLLLPVFGLAWGLLALVGRASARATTYSLTNRRLILHIGVAYEMTVSIPLSAITGAALRRRPDGSGEIALRVREKGGIGYIALWPHARFGRFLDPQPMLRGLADPDTVRDLIADALVDFNAGGRTRREPILVPQAVAA